MSTYPPGYAAPEVPIFVPEADAISSFNTGSLAIAAGGEILMNKDESTHAVLQFNKDINGTDFINMGIRSITITDASGNIVPETETLCYTDNDNKFDIMAVGGIVIKGIEDATFEGGSAIYASNDAIWMPALNVSSINGAEFPGAASVVSSFTTLYTETLEATKTITAGTYNAITAVNAPEVAASNLTVSSINGNSVVQKCGLWHRASAQTINTTGNPSAVSVSWSAYSDWTDTSTISQNVSPGANFTVNQNGIYQLNFQVQYSNLTAATFSDRTLRCGVGVTRGGGNATVIQTNYDFNDNVPSNPAQQCSGLVELKNGDQLYLQVSQYLSSGSFALQGPSAAPNDYDLNTFWSWNLVKPL